MSDDEIDVEFRRVADAFIDQANKHAETVKREHVGMALLYAAARFNAFVVAAHAPHVEKFDADRSKAVEFFRAEYVRMLEENLDDYRGIYDVPGADEEPPPSH